MTIALAEQRGVLTVTLSRPEARNALTMKMVEELGTAFTAAEAREDLRALVLRGSGKNFCAGADLKDLLRARGDHDAIAATNAAFGRLCAAFARLSVPTICVLTGAVLGGGFGLACACDFALADESASFGLPETSLGVAPAQIAPFLIERLGFSQAKRLALMGGTVHAQEALAVGLIHELHADADALELALGVLLQRLRRCAPRATRITKRLALRAREGDLDAFVAHAAQEFAVQLASPEGGEGVAAFVQKRAPAWSLE